MIDLLSNNLEQPKVSLLHYTPLETVIWAIRGCWDSHDKMDSSNGILGSKDAKLLQKILESKHESTIEHCSYTFWIEGISRALLQELARHRIASLSVQSTRYTLKKGMKQPTKTLYRSTGDEILDTHIEDTIQKMVSLTSPNDLLKYALPEAFKVNLTYTINARSFRNLLGLRLAPTALPEFRVLAHTMLSQLPQDHLRHLYSDIIEKYYGQKGILNVD